MNRLNIEAAAITHIGAVKSSNEDNYYMNGKYKSDSGISTDGIADKKLRSSYTYAVCDGMGGESYGELASLIAAATLEKFKATDIRQTLKSYMKTTNDFIYDLIRKNKNIRSGAALSLLNIQGNTNTAIAYLIGGCIEYFCRKGHLYLLSKDYEHELPEHYFTEYLGTLPGEPMATARASDEVVVKKGDTFLLCSSGVTEVLTDSEIVEFISNDKDSAITMTKKLVAVAQDGDNDVTAIVVKVLQA